jgi:hypothetical protein
MLAPAPAGFSPVPGPTCRFEDDATFGTHHQVEIAEPNVEIYDDHLVAEVSESGSERSRRSGFTDAAFA